MQDQLDQTKSQVITALGQAAESLRNAAALTEGFSALLQHASFVPTSHTHSQLLSSVQLFSQYNQLFGNNLQNDSSNVNRSLPLHVANTVPPPPTTGTPTDTRPPLPPQPTSPTFEAEDPAKGKRKRVVQKEKKVKDPNAPKRPASAYILFQNDVRKEYVTRFPEKPYHEVLTEISKRWSAMTDQEKSRYNEATQVAKAQYIINKKNYENVLANGAHSNPTSPQTPAPDLDDVSEDEEKETEKELKPAADADESDESEEDDIVKQPLKKLRGIAPPLPPKPVLQATTEENKKEKKKREKKKTGD